MKEVRSWDSEWDVPAAVVVGRLGKLRGKLGARRRRFGEEGKYWCHGTTSDTKDTGRASSSMKEMCVCGGRLRQCVWMFVRWGEDTNKHACED